MLKNLKKRNTSETSQASKMELSVETVNGFQPLTFFIKILNLDVLLDSELDLIEASITFLKYWKLQ